jgi:hypothetical protein
LAAPRGLPVVQGHLGLDGIASPLWAVMINA